MIWGSPTVLGLSLAAAVAATAVKRRAGRLAPSLLTAVQTLAGPALLLAIGIPLEASPLRFRWTPMAIASLLYPTFVGSTPPTVLHCWLIAWIPVAQVQLIPLLSTLVAVLVGAAVLGERPGWWTALGGVGAVAGLILQRTPSARRAAHGGRKDLRL